MKRSRKNTNRRALRRRRQAREKKQRALSREAKRYVPSESNLRTFLYQHIVELLLIVILVIGVLFIKSFAPDKKAGDALRDSFNPLLADQSLDWDKEFPYGYKVIVFTDEGITHTSFDTLPEDLKIDWKKMVVTRIQANRLNNTIEKIKITIADINYAQEGAVGLSVMATLSRQKGTLASLTKFGKLQFFAKIVDDEEGQLFFLLGLKGI